MRLKALKNVILPLVTLAAVSVCVRAEIPAGYYSSINGKREAELKTALHTLLYNHTLISSYSNLPTYFLKTDVYPPENERYGQWWDMYSDIPLYTPKFWGLNREHSFPKSWWGGSTETPAYIDLNHLYPSEAAANMAKSNYPLGTVSGKADFDNGITRVGYPVSGQGGGARMVFEPDDEYKGDFARTYFYMVTCYQNLTWKYTWMVSNNTYPTLNSWAVDLLLQWHRDDPVSQKELLRNEEVYKVQANRNPFIDYPQLAEYLWGTLQGQPFNIDNLISGDPVLITPVQDMALEFGETAVNTSGEASLQVRGENLTTNPEFTLTGADRGMFALETGSVSAADANKPDGTWVRVYYRPTTLGEHSARLVVSSYDGAKSRGIALRGTSLPQPTLTALTARAATDVTATSYTASWDEPSNQTVDYYVVTRTFYPAGAPSHSEEQVAETNTFTFTDCTPSATESYHVRSCRLGFYSPVSNEVYVTLAAGIEGIAADTPAPMGWRIDLSGQVVFTLPEGATADGIVVYDLQGRIVARLDGVRDGTPLNDGAHSLSPGGYIVTAPNLSTPLRIIY